MILDTSVIIDMMNNNDEIIDDITIITLIEYPPIKDYEKFRGKIYFINEDDQILAYTLQVLLRSKGIPVSVGDLLISAVCINRDEALVTRDRAFLRIREVEPRFKVVFKE